MRQSVEEAEDRTPPRYIGISEWHVSGGTPNLRHARWTQQRSSPLHDAPMHSGQSAYNDRLQQRHPLMRIRSDLCEEIY